MDRICSRHGWLVAAPSATVGTTAQRPAIMHGQVYIDTTISAMVTWDALGGVWLHHLTGAAS